MNRHLHEPESTRTHIPCILAALLCCALSTGWTEAELNLYEWIAVAPDLVVARILGNDGKYILARVEITLKGKIEPGTEILVDQRTANRNRTSSQGRLRLKDGLRYMLLLSETGRNKPSAPTRYTLARGVDGAREMPKEGGEAILAAIDTFVPIQETGNDNAVWWRFTEILETGENHLVTETVLDMFLKFRRGQPDLILSLELLLEHPRPRIRSRTARLIGQIVDRHDGKTPEGIDLRASLLARARTDRSVDVRVAATTALGSLPGAQIDPILKEIARKDPDQAVRYAAEKLLYEKMESTPGPEAGDPERSD